MKHWEVQHLTLDGWINATTDGDGHPIQFNTEAEAQLDLQDLMCELKDAVDQGDMADYNPDDWRVQAVEV